MGIFDDISSGLSGLARGAGDILEPLADKVESITGEKSKRHAKKTAEREAAERAKVEERSTKLGEALAEKRTGLEEARATEAPTATAERIQRAGVQDVTGGDIKAATIAQTPQAEFRQQQAGLAQALASRAAGTAGPSAAQIQLQRASERNIAQQAAMQAGAQGAGAALARRQIAQQGAAAGQQLAGQAAILQAQEQQAAQQQLAQLAGQARGQDIGLAQAQAGMEQQAILAQADQTLRAQLANQGVDLDVLKQNAAAGNQVALANLQAELSKMGMDDAMIQSYLAGETGLIAGQQQALLAQQQMAAQQRATEAAAKSSTTGGLISAAGALGSAAMMMSSDENVKTNIKKIDPVEEQSKKNKKALTEAIKGMGKAGEVKDVGSGIASAGMSIAEALMKSQASSGGAAATSDEDVKENKKMPGNKLDELMDNLHAAEYEYKDGKYGEEGKHVSVMAQDLQKSELGNRAVMEGEDGTLKVDYSKLLPAILAESVHQRKKIMKLEDALRAKKSKKGE